MSARYTTLHNVTQRVSTFQWWTARGRVCSTHSDIRAAPPSGRPPAARAGRGRAERRARSGHLQCCVCTHTSHGPGREREREREKESEGERERAH